MARQVYFDPFGSRVDGYRAGVSDEMKMQEGTRQARASDYDFNEIAPIRMERLQRQNALEAYGDPYMRNQFGLTQRANSAAVAGAELGLTAEIGQATGQYAPYLARAYNFGSGNDVGSEAMVPGQVRTYGDVMQNKAPDIAAIAQQFGVSPQAFQQFLEAQTGEINQQMEQGVDQYFGFDRTRTMALDNRTLNNDTFDQDMSRVQEQRQQQSADQQAQYQRDQAWRWGMQYGQQAPVQYDASGMPIQYDDFGVPAQAGAAPQGEPQPVDEDGF